MREKALLVMVNETQEAATELEALSLSAGLLVAGTLVFKRQEPDRRLLIGEGQAKRIQEAAKKLRADVVVFDANLTSAQQRNLEEVVETKTIDRVQLILDIFAARARSMEGKLQVELAQLQYLLPRLSGEGIHLSRLGGGVGTRGPGEQKLEMDKRRIRERIARLSQTLERLKDRRASAIEKKKANDLPIVALVGYTNAGKSSLFNRLTESRALVKDQLFSTLDTTTRAFTLPNRQKVLLVDTVGFVRRLPHDLVESFKATLEEALHADVLLHVIDASRADVVSQKEAVEGVLRELGAVGKETYLLYNKCDTLDVRVRSLIATADAKTFFVSAKNGEGLAQLEGALGAHFDEGRRRTNFFVPHGKERILDLVYGKGQVLGRRDTETGTHLEVSISEKNEHIVRSRLTEDG